ncbi:hypothetical protein BASA83_013010 [Batrachochytrium salamandrivorans]|nr:hypothetical protein BASA83_013010 [Batrachochytrium salamandrivorans]
MSLKRRDDSEGSSGENSGSDPSPPSATTFKPRIGDGFTKEEILTINIASTIDRAINGDYTMLYMQEDAGNKIGGRIGSMVAEYIGISTHVIDVLIRWDQGSMSGIRDFIKSGLGDEKYSEVEQSLTEKIKDFEYVSNDESKAINTTTEDIIDRRGTVTENIQKIDNSFRLIVNSQVLLLLKLKDLLGRFDDGKTLEGHVSDINRSLSDFYKYRNRLSFKLMSNLDAAASEQCSSQPTQTQNELNFFVHEK